MVTQATLEPWRPPFHAGHVRGCGLTQAESAKDTSGKLRVTYSFRVHTATTRVPASVKKASNPEPLLVKKLRGGQANHACFFLLTLAVGPWPWAVTHLYSCFRWRGRLGAEVGAVSVGCRQSQAWKVKPGPGHR